MINRCLALSYLVNVGQVEAKLGSITISAIFRPVSSVARAGTPLRFMYLLFIIRFILFKLSFANIVFTLHVVVFFGQAGIIFEIFS